MNITLIKNMPKKEKTVLIIALILAILGTITLLYNIISAFVNNPKYSWQVFCYFTIQSNFLCVFACYVYLIPKLINKLELEQNNKFFKLFQNNNFVVTVASYITITFLIYWAILFPMFIAHPSGSVIGWMTDLWLHLFTPLLFITFTTLKVKHLTEVTSKFKTNSQIALATLRRYIYPVVYFIFVAIIIQVATDWPVYGDASNFFDDKTRTMAIIYSVIAMSAFIISIVVWMMLERFLMKKSKKITTLT